MVLFAADSIVILVEMVTIFTSNPAGIFDGVDGEAVGTDARQVRPTVARENAGDVEIGTLFNVAVVVAIDMTCADGVLANWVPRGET